MSKTEEIKEAKKITDPTERMRAIKKIIEKYEKLGNK